ncbi:MAG TPA: alanine racemase [Spirochaetia bacterium]|nr:alanine racemase [Spirochaetia bacterium]
MSSLVWVEIDAQAPNHNMEEIRRGSAPGTLACAVVKSNAYGHGVASFASLVTSADWFGVNSLEEGLELRALGVTKPIILLGHVPLADLPAAIEADLALTVYNRETIDTISALRSVPRPARVHVKVDTGTARQGVLPQDLEGFIRLVLAGRNLSLEGLSTHFANIEDTLNNEYAELQLTRFNAAAACVEAIAGKLPYVHTACTAAALLSPSTQFTMLRTGIGLYGLWPSRETFISMREKGASVDFRPVLSWKTRIVQVKMIPEGSYVGYGCSYRTTRRTTLGVLPVGYADGYDRAMGNRAYVLVRGRRAPVIGRICMNLCMVDLTDVPGAKLEDEVVLLGRSGDERISAETLAEWAGTINYEIVTRISPFLPRKVVSPSLRNAS